MTDTLDIDALDLLIRTQSPISRPDPIEQPRDERDLRPRPMEPPPRQFAPQTGAPARAPDRLDMDALDLMRPQAPATTATRPAADPNAEPDAPTWTGRRLQDIRGRRDPRYAGTPTIAEAMLKEPGNSNLGQALQESGRWLLGASDADMARFYKERLGQRFLGLEKDANGADLIRYRDPSGREARAYVNAPGLDAQDVTRGVLGALPYVATGAVAGLASAGRGVMARLGAQGASGAATSVAQDAIGAATKTTENTLGESALKAGVAALGGAAGEGAGLALSGVWRRIVVEPRFYNQASGALTPAGETAARAAGLDPATLPREVANDFAKAMARTGNTEVAARQAVSGEFQIPRTMGEATGNMPQLLREQAMREAAIYGQGPADAMRGFRARQDEAITRAVTEVGSDIAPGRVGLPPTKGEMGANVRGSATAAFDAARKVERKAWDAVPKIKATQQALAELPKAVERRLGSDVVIDEVTTPAATKLAQRLDLFMKGEAPAKAAGVLPDGAIGDVGTMRKSLLSYVKAAGTPEDKRAASALYDAFNDWVEVAAKEAGDPTAAAAMLAARGITRQIHDVFDGQAGTAGANIMRKLLKDNNSPEEVINALFSAPGRSEIKAGSAQALGQLKRAYDTYLPPEAAKAAWDDLRLSLWLRIARDRSGEYAGPQGLSKSIQAALNNQQSLMRTLFSNDELARMQRMAGTLAEVARRDPNKSRSGMAVGQMMRDFGNAIVTMLGANTVIGRMAINMAAAPARGAYGLTQASRATGGGSGAVAPTRVYPSIGGYGAGAAVGAETVNR